MIGAVIHAMIDAVPALDLPGGLAPNPSQAAGGDLYATYVVNQDAPITASGTSGDGTRVAEARVVFWNAKYDKAADARDKVLNAVVGLTGVQYASRYIQAVFASGDQDEYDDDTQRHGVGLTLTIWHQPIG